MVFNRSNGIYRSVIVAIAGLILTGANPPAKQEPNGTSVSNKQPAKTATFVSDKYKLHANKYSEACYYANSHDSADLCVQWRAAIAAEKSAYATTWANWISTAGALLSFLSIILVLVALGQNRAALTIAKDEFETARTEASSLARETASALAQARRGADAATQQSVVANKIFVHEFRPFVMARALSLMVQTESGQPFTVVLIANIGRGVAKACKVYAATEVADWENPIFGGLEQCGKTTVHLMPNQPLDLPVRPKLPFTSDELKEIQRGKPNRMWTHGRVEYFDESGGQHTTWFAFAYSGGPIIKTENSDIRYEMNLELPAPT